MSADPYISLEEHPIKPPCNLNALALQLLIINILRLGINKMLKVVNLILTLLQPFLCRRIRRKLIMDLILLLCHINLIVGAGQGRPNLLLDLGQLLLLP